MNLHRDDLASPSVEREVEAMCLEFVDEWKANMRPRIEDYVARASPGAQSHVVRELVAEEVELRQRACAGVQREEYHDRFPNWIAEINAAFESVERHQDLSGVSDKSQSSTWDRLKGTATQGNSSTPPDEPMPDTIGRFQIQKKLGSGSFAVVYLARDPDLDRLVALKVPRVGKFGSNDEREKFLSEARTAVKLEYPGIVTVHDVFSVGDRAVIVQRYIAGQDLRQKIKSGPLDAQVAAKLMMAIGGAVDFAHRKDFVHRDLKPENILLDEEGKPYVADFGLALHETTQRRCRGEQSGTPLYMSPEQVRGESHHLDGRSDIWSLGVILYEMLTGRCPFLGEDLDELYDEIKYRSPKPPSQIVSELDPELERVCLKCLAKRMDDRYSNAAALSHDLQSWLAGASKVTPAQVVTMPPEIAHKGLSASSKRWLAATGALALVIVVSVFYWKWEHRNQDAPLQITSFDVTRFLQEDFRGLVGVLGMKTFKTMEGDSLRVEAHFSRPAYCYLIAFNADGSEQLCYPVDATKPQVESELIYAFGLTDGPGQQAFVVVASETALPTYQEWRAELNNTLWTSSPPSGPVLRFDGRDLQVLREEKDLEHGTVRRLKESPEFPEFSDLCQRIKSHLQLGSFQAIAFPVHSP